MVEQLFVLKSLYLNETYIQTALFDEKALHAMVLVLSL